MKKICIVLGTRPEIIKLSPLIAKLKKAIVVHTGQHYSFEMDQLFFKELQLPKPKYHLNVGSGKQGRQTAKMLEGLEKVFSKEKPALVMVLGDTNSTLAGSLAASKMGIPLCHIEAGCRSFNKDMPEEKNRIIADHLSNYLLTPDTLAVQHLKKEGIDRGVHTVGSLVVDACLRNRRLARKSKILEKLKITPKNYVVATIHRAENTDSRKNLKELIQGISEVAKTLPVIFPVHPRTAQLLKGNCKPGKGVILIPPLGYLDFLKLMENASFLMSDSGGVQEEAATLNVPCLILRKETEWMRLVHLGKNQILGTSKKEIISKVAKLFKNPKTLEEMRKKDAQLVLNVATKISNFLKAQGF